MLIMITSRCHMECPHCMQDAGHRQRHDALMSYTVDMDGQPWRKENE